MKHIFCREVSRFSICDTCADISDRMSSTMDQRELKELKIRKESHIAIVRAEREVYYDKELGRFRQVTDSYP